MAKKVNIALPQLFPNRISVAGIDVEFSVECKGWGCLQWYHSIWSIPKVAFIPALWASSTEPHDTPFKIVRQLLCDVWTQYQSPPPFLLSTTIRWYPNCVWIGPMIWPTLVFGLKTTSSNSFTIVPGPKLPRDPPLDFDGQVEYFAAMEEKLDSPFAISPRTVLASSSVGTRIWRALAFTASGGAPYSSLPNAFWNESNIPMNRGVEMCRLEVWHVGTGENASTAESPAAMTANIVKTKKEEEAMIGYWCPWYCDLQHWDCNSTPGT